MEGNQTHRRVRSGRVGSSTSGWMAIWIACSFPACTTPPSTGTLVEVSALVQLADGSALTVDHTCHGPGHSPPLGWSADALPAGTTHLAWLVRSPSGVSWAAWDAPIDLDGLPGHFPAAHAPPLQGGNHAGRVGWAPPCPPRGGDPIEGAVEVVAWALPEPLAAPPTIAVPHLLDRLSRHAIARSSSRLDLHTSP